MVSESTIQFLKDLKTNNNREWFLDNKKRYEAVKKEYYQITADFLDSMKPLDPALELLEVKNCVFRINRDIRFSKDKSPYKTNLGIGFLLVPKILKRLDIIYKSMPKILLLAAECIVRNPNKFRKSEKKSTFFMTI